MSDAIPVESGLCTFCGAKSRSDGVEVNSFPVCRDPKCAEKAERHVPCQWCGGAMDPRDIGFNPDYCTDHVEALRWPSFGED